MIRKKRRTNLAGQLSHQAGNDFHPDIVARVSAHPSSLLGIKRCYTDGMNKGLLLAVGVIAFVALSVWFFTTTSTLPVAEDTATTTAVATPEVKVPAPRAAPAAAAPKGVPNSTTYKSLLTQSGSYQCDYDQVQSSGQSHNVIYIYNGRMRGEFRLALFEHQMQV